MINHPNSSRLHKASIFRLKQIIQALASCSYLESYMRTSSIRVVLFATVCLTAIATNLLGASSQVAVAQMSSTSEDEILSERSISQVNVLFVNPSIGNDNGADGSESTPFKTITQALKVAENNTVIKLSKGTYSAENGEQFPLIVKKGISIEGNVRDLGKDIIIQGGGNYLSRYYGSKNIAIVAIGKGKLAGVTLTNPNPRGYGLWIESGQAGVEANTFTGSTQDGVAVGGRATPKIAKNYFYRNGANGITVSGNSQPQIQENQFYDTGFGVNIVQNASPKVIGNRISHNRTGVVAQAASSPILRNNSIFNNKEDGLVVISKATPDLGNSSNPGGNQFRLNGRYDINAKAAKQKISAYGNTFSNRRIVGKIDVTAFAAPVKATMTQLPRSTPPLLKPVSRRPTRPTPPKPVAQPQKNTQEQQQINYVEVQPNTIEFTAPNAASQPIPAQPPANTPSLPVLEAAPTGEAALLAVPQAKIPATNNGNLNLPAPRATGNSPTNQKPPQIQARTTPIDSRYRVIVDAVTPRQQELVKYIVPDAFRTRRKGRMVMQAGIFDDSTKANQLLTIFKKNGLKARIEAMK